MDVRSRSTSQVYVYVPLRLRKCLVETFSAFRFNRGANWLKMVGPGVPRKCLRETDVVFHLCPPPLSDDLKAIWVCQTTQFLISALKDAQYDLSDSKYFHLDQQRNSLWLSNFSTAPP